MRAANDHASLHIHIVSPEPSLIAFKRRDVDEGLGQIVLPVHVIYGFSHMRAANDQASLHILLSLARTFADCT